MADIINQWKKRKKLEKKQVIWDFGWSICSDLNNKNTALKIYSGENL